MPQGQQQPIPSVWTRPRPRREHLTRERIVTEAVGLLDAHGIEALSMRTLGTRLGAGATSLYRHVANRDELIELVVDEVYGELEIPAAPDRAAWRPAVVEAATALRAMVLRHPWVASVLSQVGLSHLGPNVMRMSDRMLALFETAGFPADETDSAMSTVVSYVIGVATSEAAYLSMIARSGGTESDWLRALRPAVEAATRAHPHLHAAHVAQHDKTPGAVRDETFDYGLQRLLDGLAARLEQLGRSAAAGS
ncbi:TetR/AcrR family transcriptional regulator [Streptomyces griseomycini]|uniref:AcrR family transcriptional regulator n=1 Tax=Streptomyces griseomycini TaxID=66895 RepID=A0A7W7VAD0_9ACTN|nr:TetR/AcrR family transcriptional regulator [Streptomyces griseomycini]MBB4902983.1 AcrR family transcriptional regulator [Streptomyces griseomycini]GGQ36519.1 TetR family transcriptional regulator [Streptomyces griseomycini]GGR51018.1 TetR family transcriptional regulator [Streptomyces griseomycini]